MHYLTEDKLRRTVSVKDSAESTTPTQTWKNAKIISNKNGFEVVANGNTMAAFSKTEAQIVEDAPKEKK